jgi:16S rRNA (cytidine1402-2'-O)-methyltransferase
VTTPHAPLLQQAASSAAGAQHYPQGALYVVATPIGNLADITLRAIHVLTLVDAIACEDTRHSAPLLRQLGIEGKALLALHQHNEREAAEGVLLRLARGERVAYISDAGTPAISDPGAALVAAVRAAGFRALPVPGASSAVAALSVAGDPADSGFVFIGFLPTKSGERAQGVAALTTERRAQIVFEAPHRVVSLAKALADACASRVVSVCRELTKQFETVASMPASELPQWFAGDDNRLRGEFVFVVHALAAAAEQASQVPAFDPTLRVLLAAALPLKQAVAITAELTGSPRNAVYERALLLKNQDPLS